MTAVCNLITTTLETHDYRFHTAGTGRGSNIRSSIPQSLILYLLDFRFARYGRH